MNENKLLSFFLAAFVILLPAFSCRQRVGDNTTDTAQTPRGNGYSPARAVIKYAHGFSIDYYDHYKEVKILNRTGGRMDTLDYLLLPDGVSVPPGHAHAQVINIPVKSLIVMSSMHIAQADFAGVAGQITGLGNGQYVNSIVVREGLKTGRIKTVGIDANLNTELVIGMVTIPDWVPPHSGPQFNT